MITIHDSRRDTESSDFFNNTDVSLKNYFFVSHTNTKKNIFICVYMTLDEIDFFDNTHDSLKNYFFVSTINTKKKYFCLCLHDSRRD